MDKWVNRAQALSNYWQTATGPSKYGFFHPQLVETRKNHEFAHECFTSPERAS